MQDTLYKTDPKSVLPGRIRTQVYGLRDNHYVKEKFEAIFSTIDGVVFASANVTTGNILLIYDEAQLPFSIINLYLHKFEDVLFQKFIQAMVVDETHMQKSAFAEIAASVDSKHSSNVSWLGRYAKEPSLSDDGSVNSIENREKVPLPLALSIGGLGILGIKQLFFGRSSFARHPFPFYISGILAIGTGYPFIKRGLQALQQRKGIPVDFILGISALTLALVRENLVVLAGLSMLQYVNWKRQKSLDEDVIDQTYVAPEIERYSRLMNIAGFSAAVVSFAITRNPLAAFAILLAANPRPITISTEYTWKQAEQIVREEDLFVPLNGSFHQLARVKQVVFDDAAIVVENNTIRPDYMEALKQLRDNGISISFLRNSINVDLHKVDQTNYHLSIIEEDQSFPEKREEVLFVLNQMINRSDTIVSHYPSVTVSQFFSVCHTLILAKQVSKRVDMYGRTTKAWNVVGSVLAASRMVQAPLLALVGDALSLVFMSRSQRWSENNLRRNVPSIPPISKDSEKEIKWHATDGEQVLAFFKSNTSLGLSQEKIKAAYEKYGKNELRRKVKPHWIYGYLGQFKEFTTIILGTTALLSIVSGHFFDGIIMGSILLFNAGISTMQERKAEQAVETLTKFVPPACLVIREGAKQEIEAAQLLPGDIILLEAGDRVPADIRILENWNVEVNESSLTGESLPVKKDSATIGKLTALGDRSNLLYLGTHITRGKLKGIVVETGNRTEMGHVLTMLTEEKKEETPLQKQITSISKTFMKVALVAGGFVFIAGLLRGMPIGQLGVTSVALTASAIPEGLPVTITIALTAGILRMAKKNTVVRKLSSLETLGRITVVCSDKTGTLTKNEMTVKKVATVHSIYDVTGTGYCPEGKICNSKGEEHECEELDQLLMIGMLCNNSKLEKQDDDWKMIGDPTEGAILTLAGKRAKWVHDHLHWKRVHEVPFDSKDRKMSVVCTEDKNEQETCYLMTKGSIEKILERCSTFQKNGEIYPLTEEIQTEIIKKNDEFAEQALRVLAFAYRPLDEKPLDGCYDGYDEDLIYVGMVGMMDPPKDDVGKSVQECIDLGIKPIMITGDHPKTALAIAKNIGIWNESQTIMTGAELDELSDEELLQNINNVAIFARVSPEHKLKIIATLQEAGQIVAMTGDGVNDSPAIRQADVGIAMGVSGTQVTKETADVILKNDGFNSIIDGVKEGRSIIGNIRNALGCLLSGNLAEIIVTSTAVIAGLPLPIIPVQILLMNLLTDALPAMVLAINPGNKSAQIKRQGIADKELYSQVIARGILLGAGSIGLFMTSLAAGLPLAVAQTTAFAALVAGQLVQTFSWRQASINEWSKDKFLIGALGISGISLLAAIYIPPLSSVFQTAALPIGAWIPIFVIASGAAIIAKPVTRMLKQRHPTMLTSPGLTAA